MIWLYGPETGCGYNSCFMYLRKPTLNLLMGARATSLLKSEGATSCAMVYELDLPKHSFIQVMCFLKPSINSSVSHGSDEVVYIYASPAFFLCLSYYSHCGVVHHELVSSAPCRAALPFSKRHSRTCDGCAVLSPGKLQRTAKFGVREIWRHCRRPDDFFKHMQRLSYAGLCRKCLCS
jgi:hypothetical protein